MRTRGPYLRLVGENADFRKLWFAQLISLGGDWFNSVALLGLVLDLTRSPQMASLVMSAALLPQFLFSPISGIAADRLNRKWLMVGSDLVRVFLALGMLLVSSRETVWIGIVFMAGIATFGSFFGPASHASTPNLVRPADLSTANVLTGSSWGTMLVVGAALGGIVASTLGRDTAFVINAASFLFSALLIMRIKGKFSEPRERHQEAHPLRDLKDGLNYARSHPEISSLLFSKSGYGIGAGLLGLLPVFGKEVFGAGDVGIGILFAARGAGALVGPIIARGFVGSDLRRLFISISVAMSLFGVGYSLFAAMPSIWPAAVMAFIAHLGGGAQWMMSTYGLQVLSPDSVRGRIFAFDFGLVTLTISLGILAAGRAAETFGPRSVMLALALFDLAYGLAWGALTAKTWRKGGQLKMLTIQPSFEGTVAGSEVDSSDRAAAS
jgi:MFS family permease